MFNKWFSLWANGIYMFNRWFLYSANDFYIQREIYTLRVLIFVCRKQLHFAGTNFREWSFTKRFAGINFRESQIFFVDSLQSVVLGGVGSIWGWRSVWGNGKMSGSVVKHLLWTRYEKLTNELYIKPKNEEIVGTFFSLANEEEKQAEAKSR